MTRCTHDCNQGRNCNCDDHGRRDLTGGLGYVLIAAIAFWLVFAGWLIWRVV